MNRKLKKVSQIILGFGILGLLLWGTLVAFSRALNWLLGLKSEVATAIIAASATVFVTLLSLVVSKYYERRGEIARENRLKKIPAYEQLISFIFSILQQGKPGFQDLTEADLIKTYSALTEKMIVWGSDEVLKSFGEFRVASLKLSQEQGLPRLMVSLEDLMLAIRRDLGYQNKGLTRGAVLRLFLNDVATADQPLVGKAP